MLKGVLEGCVLEIISRGDTYGYEITRRLNALGFTDVVEGTVYTILIRLEKSKLVEITKKPSDMGPPQFLTPRVRNCGGSGKNGNLSRQKSMS